MARIYDEADTATALNRLQVGEAIELCDGSVIQRVEAFYDEESGDWYTLEEVQGMVDGVIESPYLRQSFQVL